MVVVYAHFIGELRKQRDNLPENSNNLLYGIVFSEVINHMKKAIESNIAPVFKLPQLKKLVCTS